MTAFATRRLGPGDPAAFREMVQLFGDVFGEPDTYGSATPGEAYVARLLASDSFYALVATEPDGRIIGALAAYELVKFEQERSEIYIYDLATAQGWRRRGVATGLIEALKPFARASGAWVMFVQADRDDPPAVALYSRLGAREDVLHFDIPVD